MSQTEAEILAQMRPRRAVKTPEDVVALLRGTPPAMPSGVTPPVVTPIVQPPGPVPLGGGQPVVAQPPIAGAAIPDAAKQKILALMANNANQPLTTTSHGQDITVDEREVPINPYSQGNETRAAIVGKGAGAGRIQTMSDHPLREVNPDGSAGNVNKMSKKRAFLLGLMKGIDKAGKDAGGHSWSTIIGGGGMGAGIGLASPTSIQKWQRREDVETEQGLLNNQQKLGQQAANIEETQAQARQRAEMPAIEAKKAASDARIAAEKLKIQRDAAAGAITAREADRKLRELALEETKRHNLAIEGKPVATDAAAAEGESLAASTSEAAKTLQVEHDKNKTTLEGNEKSLTQKEGSWNAAAAKIVADSGGLVKLSEAFEQAKAADPDVQSGQYAETLENTKRLREAVPENEKRLLAMNEDVRKGTAKASRRPAAAPTGGATYAGKRFSRAKVAERAKSLGMTIAQAEKTITDGGGEIF